MEDLVKGPALAGAQSLLPSGLRPQPISFSLCWVQGASLPGAAPEKEQIPRGGNNWYILSDLRG